MRSVGDTLSPALVDSGIATLTATSEPVLLRVYQHVPQSCNTILHLRQIHRLYTRITASWTCGNRLVLEGSVEIFSN